MDNKTTGTQSAPRKRTEVIIDNGRIQATAEFKEYYDLLVGGKMNQSYEDFFGCVFIINAIMRALESGKEEPVGRL